MSIKKVLEQVKNRDFDVVRVILLSHSFAFNLDIKAFKNIKDEEEKEQALLGLLFQYKLPKSFILDYTKTQTLNVNDLETQLCVYEVYGRALDNGENIIEQDGLYIKFDPEKSDRFYKKVIKRLRSTHEFQTASEEEKRRFNRESGKSSYHYNADKKSHQKRKQHGQNFEEDIKVYLTCEKAFKEIDSSMGYAVNTGDNKVNKEDREAFIKNALSFAAEELKMQPQKAKDIYYEVCNRYQLPTLRKNLPVPAFLGTLVKS